MDLTWETFNDAFIQPGIPAVHTIHEASGAQLFVDGGGSRIGLWVPLGDSRDKLPRSGPALSIATVELAGKRCAQIATVNPDLFKNFYALSSEIMDRIARGEPPAAALNGAVDGWRALVRVQGGLSREGELGLWGELYVLKGMLARDGDAPLYGWNGPMGDPHDLRYAGREYEVKTTLGARHCHVISSLEQLVPSAGHVLSILSLLVAREPSPAGCDLPELVESVRAMLDLAGRRELDERLEMLGYVDDLAHLYCRAFVPRSPVISVDVDEICPAITRDHLVAGCGAVRASRIVNATYRVELDGLGTIFLDLDP